MASVRYRKRGDSNLWTYEIRNEGKTVVHNSGFKTKKLAEMCIRDSNESFHVCVFAQCCRSGGF